MVCVDEDGTRRFRMMRWGLLPPFVRDPKAGPPMINARAEGVAKNSAYKRAFAERRCLVPADGFYEWTGPKGARRPFLLRPRKGGLIAFAGIWERWRDRAGNEIDSVAIITCDSNAVVARLHDRMPVVLRPEHYEAWLDCKRTDVTAAQEMLKPAPDDLLEASGVADPSGIALTFMDEDMRDRIRLDSIMCVVDAEQIFAAPEMMELKLRQVAFADMLILNKVDLVAREEIERI